MRRPPDHEIDRVVIGAGIFGLYAAIILGRRGLRVAIVDLETRPLSRASLVNQARIHMGYHYPRSVLTALQAARRSDQFLQDFPGAVMDEFRHIYAIARAGTLTSAESFERFCTHLSIPIRPVEVSTYFHPVAVEAAYETQEFSFDAANLRKDLLKRIEGIGTVEWYLGSTVEEAGRDGNSYVLSLRGGPTLKTEGVVNATYAGSNEIIRRFGFDPLPLKYELCEIVLTRASDAAQGLGVTVIDGPFFSLMPFGRTRMHSLTAVDYTPRIKSSATLPTFSCQELNRRCTPGALDNCSVCPARPVTAFPVMLQVARRYLNSELDVKYEESMYAVKAVLETAEVDDGRPTMVVRYSERPQFVTIFSGKVTTLYDLEEVL
jgi:2-polyprenyl-6-methoxyphenol hydroxylase-like FAD-dependent oxidoreductase